MKKEIEINERIESYLNGNLPTHEMDYFLKMMKENPSFAQEVEKHKMLRELIVDGAYLHVKNELKNIHLRKIQGVRNIKRMTGYGLSGLVIGLILFFAIKNNSVKQQNTKINNYVKIEKNKAVTDLNENKNLIPRTEESVNITEQNQKENELLEVETKDILEGSINEIDDNAIHVDPSVNENKETHFLSDVPTILPVDSGTKITNNSITDESVNSKKINCRKVKFSAMITVEESCNNSPTGSFTINRHSITGGQPPYAFSLNRNNFIDTIRFASLYPGNYPVYIRDGNNCTGIAGIAQIGSVDCTYQAVFAPLKGEVWTVPVNQSGEGILQIFSKSGMLVFSCKVYGGETTEWNGETLSDQQLPMGIYHFEIMYTDGKRFAGNVTILK
jgi:hypothetical protein